MDRVWRNCYRVVIAALIGWPIGWVLTMIVRYIPTGGALEADDLRRLNISLYIGAMIFGLYVIYYIEVVSQRSVPIPISTAELYAKAPVASIITECQSALQELGATSIRVDQAQSRIQAQAGSRRNPTLIL